jgi:hypothetical protein
MQPVKDSAPEETHGHDTQCSTSNGDKLVHASGFFSPGNFFSQLFTLCQSLLVDIGYKL